MRAARGTARRARSGARTGAGGRPGASGAFWRAGRAAIETELDARADGLTEPEAARRLEAEGPNLLKPRRQRSLALQFLSRFANPLVLLLLVAAGISAFTGDVASFVIIAVMVMLSVTLDFLQEHRADRAAERLKRSVALRAMVLRGGRTIETTADQIVPGDLVLLRAGALVPADGLILEARDFFVNQALLTGESYPVEKRPGDLPEAAADMTAAHNAAFMGTSVVGGTATLLVCRTGSETSLGEIGESLLQRPPATAFELGIRSFGVLILRLAILMVLFVLLVNAWFHRPWLESFLFAVALAVGLTPELLPMVVSITLARGALRMAKERVIVKRLPAVHDLGSMDVLCTDKTGTLTEAEIRLERHVDPLGRPSARTLELVVLNSSMESGLRGPLDDAILRHTEVDISNWSKIDEVPFDFERRCVSVLADDGARRRLVLKGAFEDVLRHSTRYEANGPADVRPLEATARQAAGGAVRGAQPRGLSRPGHRLEGHAARSSSCRDRRRDGTGLRGICGLRGSAEGQRRRKRCVR